jgi:hypothetical protein
MKKPSRLTTGLALSSSLFAAVVAFAAVGPQQAPNAVSHSTPAKAQAAAATTPSLSVPTAVSRLVRQAAAGPAAGSRANVG